MKLITATGDTTQQALQTCADQWCKANHMPLRPVIMHETVSSCVSPRPNLLYPPDDYGAHATRPHQAARYRQNSLFLRGFLVFRPRSANDSAYHTHNHAFLTMVKTRAHWHPVCRL